MVEDAGDTETEARDFATFKRQRAPLMREDLKAGLLNVAVLGGSVAFRFLLTCWQALHHATR